MHFLFATIFQCTQMQIAAWYAMKWNGTHRVASTFDAVKCDANASCSYGLWNQSRYERMMLHSFCCIRWSLIGQMLKTCWIAKDDCGRACEDARCCILHGKNTTSFFIGKNCDFEQPSSWYEDFSFFMSLKIDRGDVCMIFNWRIQIYKKKKKCLCFGYQPFIYEPTF